MSMFELCESEEDFASVVRKEYELSKQTAQRLERKSREARQLYEDALERHKTIDAVYATLDDPDAICKRIKERNKLEAADERRELEFLERHQERLNEQIQRKRKALEELEKEPKRTRKRNQ